MVSGEEKWVGKAKAGSRRAFDQLVKIYTAPVFRYMLDMTRHYQDAQDLTQEVFLRAYLHIKRFRGDSRFSTWLYRIAHNISMDYFRKKKRMRQESLNSQGMQIAERGIRSGEAGYSGEKEAINKALAGLPDSQRSAVVLNVYHGFRMREIAEILGCAEATARVHLFRGLQNLRKQLKDYSPES
jgi:RNA polymerase sigma-70 factor (ECF subfamily)